MSDRDFVGELQGQQACKSWRSQEDLTRQSRLSEYYRALGLHNARDIGAAIDPKPQSKGEPMLEKLKNLTETLALKGAVDALVELAAYGRMLLGEYEAQKIPAPKWLEPNLKALGQEIRARWQAERRAQLLAAEKELEELRSREEKRAAKEEEIKRLREELGE